MFSLPLSHFFRRTPMRIIVLWSLPSNYIFQLYIYIILYIYYIHIYIIYIYTSRIVSTFFHCVPPLVIQKNYDLQRQVSREVEWAPVRDAKGRHGPETARRKASEWRLRGCGWTMVVEFSSVLMMFKWRMKHQSIGILW